MTFLNGITHLTNWMGNVIMPTVAGLVFRVRRGAVRARLSRINTSPGRD